MKVLMINSVCGVGSTGRICTDIAQELEKQGHEVKIAYGRDGYVPEQFKKFAIRIGTDFDVRMHGLEARLFDASGFGSKKATKKFIDWVREYDPDVIHLHNIHGYYINVEILFNYLKTCNKKIIWTLHDCWAFTGHCSHYTYEHCEKWKTECKNCGHIKTYPKSLIDNSLRNFCEKKDIFTNIQNLIIVTPSEWLKKQVEQSFLKEYQIKVIRNGIDLNVFYKRKTNIKERYGLSNKKIILGVSSVWNKKKGLDYFCELSSLINDEYKMVLVGVNEKQQKHIPDNILSIKKTNDINELAEWYSCADVFVNPTLEDTYPTTNLESIACGTPVITFDTGGSPESAKNYGIVLEDKDTISLYRKIKLIKKSEMRLRIKNMSIDEMVCEYTNLYF